jgi:hypothetical protein
MVEYSGGCWNTLRSTPLEDLDQGIRFSEGIFLEFLDELAQRPPGTPLRPLLRSPEKVCGKLDMLLFRQ